MLARINPDHDIVHLDKFLKPSSLFVLPEGFEVKVKQYDCVAIVSGGLDSTTLVYDLIDKGHTPHLVSFNYGQRHAKELQYAAMTARQLELRHDTVDLTGLTHLISNSALTGLGGIEYTDGDPSYVKSVHNPIEVPEGHYAEETMKQTVVPNRNMIMLSIAAGIAVNNQYKFVAIGVHAGDHFIYPDCRPEFIEAMREAIEVATEGFGNWEEEDTLRGRVVHPLYSPFLHKSKADIAYRALELGVPLHLTWSCYKGGLMHCGRCGTCVERLEAINEATYKWLNNSEDKAPLDQTEYEDVEFWKQAVREAKSK